MRRKKRTLAIIRGPGLNPWEMQNYYPLKDKYQILSFASYGNRQVKVIDLPIKQLICLGEIVSFVPLAISLLYLIYGDPQKLFGMEEAITGFEIVHTAEIYSAYSYQCLNLKKTNSIGILIVTIWETIPFLHEEYPVQKRIKHEFLTYADCFIAPTKQAKKALLKEGTDPGKISVIPMGVDCSLFKPCQKDPKLLAKYNLNSSDRIILSVGRLVVEKGFDLILKALSRINDTKKPVKLLIVGIGPYLDKLIALTDKLKLGNKVVFLGNIAYKEMPQIYNLADLFILGSRRTVYWEEQFGMVVVEAMACGIPVLVSESEVTREVVENCGEYFQQENAKDLERKITKFLRMKKNLYGKKGRRRAVTCFNSHKVSQKIDQLYQKVLKDKA